MDEPLLPCVEIEPEHLPARSAVIWLHGLGADGHDFEPIVPELRLHPGLRTRFVFPHAPPMPVTVNAGMIMPAWYDIQGLDFDRRHDEAGIRRSAGEIERLITREVDNGIASDRIVLAGFSQGGAIALYLGLQHRQALAGLMALSAYLVLPDSIPLGPGSVNARTPIFMAHGTFDPVVPYERGKSSMELLRRHGHQVEWRDYPMQHQVCLEEIGHVGEWLAARLSPESP